MYFFKNLYLLNSYPIKKFQIFHLKLFLIHLYIPFKNIFQKLREIEFVLINQIFVIGYMISKKNILKQIFQYYCIIVTKFHIKPQLITFSKSVKQMFEDRSPITNHEPQKIQVHSQSHIIHQTTPQFINEDLQQLRAYRQSLENQVKKLNSKNHGLSNRFMKLIKNMKMGKSSQTCSICISPFEHDQIIKRLPCKHIFHRECAKSWLKINKTCPVCRMDLQAHFQQLEKKEILS